MSDAATGAVPAAEPVAVPAVSSAAETAPAVPAAADAPAAAAAAEPTLVEPVAAPADEAAASPTLTAHTDTPGVLSADEKPAEPDAAAAKGDETPAEPAASAANEPLRYEAPTLPEGVELEAESLGAFDTLIGQHGVPAETRQALIDMYVAERQADAQRTLQAQHDAFAEWRAEQRKAVMADPEIGGAGFETSRNAALRMIDLFVPQQHRDAFNSMLMTTGAIDHPEMVRLLVNIAKKFDEPAPAPVPTRPPPNIGQRPRSGGRPDWYNSSKQS